MNSLIIILLQLTGFLGFAVLLATAFSSNASRAHRVLAVALACVILLPIGSLTFAQLGWGFFSQNDSTETVPPPSSTANNAPIAQASETESIQLAAHNLNRIPQVENLPPQTAKAFNNHLMAPPPQSEAKINQASIAGQFADTQFVCGGALRTKESFSFPWRISLLIVWSTWSLVFLVRVIRGFIAARGILRRSHPVTDHILLATLNSAGLAMKYGGKVNLTHSTEVDCPVIWSWSDVTIVIPTATLDAPIDWKAVFSHELAHLRRADHWTSLVAEVARCVLPWHPLVLFSVNRLYRLSEVACDAWAVTNSESPEKYADSLLAFTPTRRLAFSSMSSTGAHLKSRIRHILESKDTPIPRAGFTFTTIVFSTAILSAGLFALARTHRPASISKAIPNSSSELKIEDLTDEQWVEKLVSVPNSARWFVGKNLGYELSLLEDGRGFRILNSCWENIGIDVRKQILKGFYPGATVNSHYFPVMNLGMSSADEGIQQFALTYLKAATYLDFTDDMEGYRAWYSTIKDKSAQEIIQSSVANFVAKAKDPETQNVRQFTQSLSRDGAVANCPMIKQAFVDAGVMDLLNEWVELEYIKASHPAFQAIATDSASVAQIASGDLTDQQWITSLTAIPNNARWHVGASAGTRLSNLPGDRAFKILNQCWDQIGPMVRRQILKGFTPGLGVATADDRYLDILELGLKSKEGEVRTTASVYLESYTLQRITTVERLNEWREFNKGKTIQVIHLEYCKKLMTNLEDLDKSELESRLREICDSIRNPMLLKAFQDSKLPELLEKLLLTEKFDLSGGSAGVLLNQFEVSAEARAKATQRDLKKLVAAYEQHANSMDSNNGHSEIWKLASALSNSGTPAMIPTMIGIIDADNSYTTVYGVGYFGLQHITKVGYSKHHDGAWWRRWWQENKSNYPEDIQNLEIPVFAKSKHGKRYRPYPEKLDTFEGNLEWLIQCHDSRQELDLALDNLAKFKDPQAIPTLIGVLDADNSPKRITAIGQCLRAITGEQYTPFSDGAAWKRWWMENKSKYPDSVRSAPIPEFSKTEHGQTYVPYPESLATLDGKIEYLQNNKVNLELFNRIIEAVDRIDESTRPASDIPKLIALIDCDNSYETIYGIGYFALGRMCDIPYDPLHDGDWWRRWWEKNKGSYPIDVQQVDIPILPKTSDGKSYIGYPEDIDTVDGKIRYLNSVDNLSPDRFRSIVRSLDSQGGFQHDTEIPKIIGIMAADNSPDTNYTIGEYVLGRKLGVKFNIFHDGAWWSRWWERNKKNFSTEAQSIPIPKINKTVFGESYDAFPDDLDSLDGTIDWIRSGCRNASKAQEEYIGLILLEHKNPRALPILIGWMLASNSMDAIGFAEDELRELTGIRTNAYQTPQWWEHWWEKNKTNYPADAQATAIPDLTDAVKRFHKQKKSQETKAQDQEFEGIPSVQRLIDGNEKKEYFQIGPPDNREAPEGGWKVLLILPGGDGSADFHPFCRRIHKHALPEGYVAVQLVAPVWADDENRVVWPTSRLNPQEATFTTEQFIRDAVNDLKKNIAINEKQVFALGWSSGGPPLYANSINEESPVTGTFVAMSVFHPRSLGDLSEAEGHPYFILHSPDDWIKIDQHAKVAVKELGKAGAITKLKTYQGGHGWRDDPFGNIRKGVNWLQTKVVEDDTAGD